MIRYTSVLLDRDGVLNREPEIGYVTKPAEWQWETNALAGLRVMADAGMHLSIVTNQSSVGRGLATLEDVERLHHFVRTEALAAGITLGEFFVCPHAPEAQCECRKPKPGLVLQALRANRVPAKETVMLGDSERDVAAGLAAGVDVALVRTGKGRAQERALSGMNIAVFDDLLQAATAWKVS